MPRVLIQSEETRSKIFIPRMKDDQMDRIREMLGGNERRRIEAMMKSAEAQIAFENHLPPFARALLRKGQPL